MIFFSDGIWIRNVLNPRNPPMLAYFLCIHVRKFTKSAALVLRLRSRYI